MLSHKKEVASDNDFTLQIINSAKGKVVVRTHISAGEGLSGIDVIISFCAQIEFLSELILHLSADCHHFGIIIHNIKTIKNLIGTAIIHHKEIEVLIRCIAELGIIGSAAAEVTTKSTKDVVLTISVEVLKGCVNKRISKTQRSETVFL